jgi:DNA-binding winged helix-turn-helix (wHTH) protein
MKVPHARAILPRRADLEALFTSVRAMTCVSVVGISNLGKSALLRSMTDPQVQETFLDGDASQYLFVYIDFNQMLEMTEQAFYELVLRCAIDALRPLQGPTDGEVLRHVETAYTGLVAPANAFEIPLRFAQAMAAIGALLPQRVVFLLDEADEPIAGIDGRVFLNLRALKDRHWEGLTYITATNRRLAQIRHDPNVAEFDELFNRHILYIAPLSDAEIADFTARFAAAEGVTFSEEDLAFVRIWSGGHPGLLEAICRVLGLLTGRPVRDRSQDWIIHRRAAEIITQDINVQAECRKIWNNLGGGEQDALLRLVGASAGETSPETDSVVAKHLVVGEGPERRIVARAFAEFVQRQRVARRPARREGLHLDLDSGEVWINDVQAPTLTNLEYRLLLLLYGRLDKICTKYEVVEAVWGEDYIDEVDDARIEKLISRLRQKIEPDAANPKYLTTVRGRGYKLVAG